MDTRDTSREVHSSTRKLNNIKSLQGILIQRQMCRHVPFVWVGFGWLILCGCKPHLQPRWDLSLRPTPQTHIPMRPEEIDIFITAESGEDWVYYNLVKYLPFTLKNYMAVVSQSLFFSFSLILLFPFPFPFFFFLQGVQAVPDLLSCEEIYLCLNHPYCCSSKSKPLAI